MKNNEKFSEKEHNKPVVFSDYDDYDDYEDYSDCARYDERLKDFDFGIGGSMLEAQLCRVKDDFYCRQCGKEIPEEQNPVKRFCSDKCKKKFDNLIEIRCAIGLYNLKTRGYD